MMSRLHFASCLLLIFPTLTLADDRQFAIADLVERTPRRGLCVLLGEFDVALPVQLAHKSELLVHVQHRAAEQVEAMRRAADQAGLLTRIFVSQGEPSKLVLADNLADAVFLFGAVANNEQVRAEALRVLHPGGVLHAGAEKIVKPFAPRTDEWRHPYHGPDNNPQSEDEVARGPFLTQFMAEPWYSAMPQMSVISAGRIFKVWGNRASKQPSWDSINTLICFNAFNGATLWRRPLEPGFLRHRNTLIATPQTLFFADDVSCQLIDPETGKTRDEIKIPPSVSDEKVWCWMALEDGVLYALLGKEEPKVEVAKYRTDFRGAGWPWWKYDQYAFGFGRTLVAIDANTKKILWKQRESDEIDMRSLCMRNGRIYFYSVGKHLGCIDARTGSSIWRSSDPKALAAIGEFAAAQHPLYGFITSSYVKCSDDALYFAGPMCKNLAAVSARDGKYLWDIKGAGNSLLVLRKEALYALGGGRINEPLKDGPPSFKLEPLTGKVLAEFASRDRCTRATGCVDAIFTRGGRGGSTAVFDVTQETPKMGVISPMRPACQDGVTIAHGLLYWGPWLCRCDATQIGMMSLTPAGKFEFGRTAREQERLQVSHTPRALEFSQSANDWPTFRRDNARSTRTTVAIPDRAKQTWTYQPAGSNVPTAPVAAGGFIYIGGSDGAVRALDAATGKLRWTAYTGGDIKYPPAVGKQRVYVGSGDGHVYCLDAVQGQELWRFRAAPVERQIPIFGSLLSTWPVGGGVLLDQDTVYAAAGNANYNGTHVYALDAVTCKIRWQNNDSGHRVDSADSGAGVQGHLLLHDGHVWMQGGNLTGLVSYRTTDGQFQRRGKLEGRYGNSAGKDLYVLGDQVNISGLPLYFRQEDSHFIEKVAMTTPHGLLAAYTDDPQAENPVSLVTLMDPKSDVKNPKMHWKSQPFLENIAVAVSANAVIVAGVNREGIAKELRATAGICALDLKTGTTLWRYELPALPCGWGAAIDREGRVIVALQDGRIVCFGK